MTKIQETGEKVVANVERVIVGKHHEVRLALVALMCRGHLLIEDVPGTGKTVLAKALARSLGCTFRRIQFTPDLLPSDVTGLSIYNQKTQEFEFRPGPIMAQVVLADEINRATPKTQSSLLECMEERQATIDGITYPMPDPFLVIATQNPIEYEGTFALPEAQLDRFMIRLRLGYPQPIEEIVILDEQKRTHPARRARGGLLQRRAARDAGRGPRGLRRQLGQRVHRPARQRHPQPRRRLPRRVAARLDRPVPGEPGLRRPDGPRLRHPRRRQGAGRAGPGPPPDHQDERHDPRRPAGPDRARAARHAAGRSSRRPPSTARARSRPLPATAVPPSDWRAEAPAPMVRRLPIIALAIVLVLAAFSSGLPFLFYLLYLGILVVGGSYVLTRLGLADLEAGYAVGQVTGHVGEQLKVTYTLRNAGRLPKPWLEVHNPTSLPVAIPGRAIGIGSRAERSWIARVPLTRRGHFRIEPLQVRTGDPFGFFEASAVVGQPISLVVYPRIDAAAPVAPAVGQHRRQPRRSRADPPDEPARDQRPALCPG